MTIEAPPVRTRRRITDAQKADMQRMLENGSTYRAIAYECGVSQVAVFRFAKRLGRTNVRASSARIDEAARLVKKGLSFKRAAQAVGLNYSTVRQGCILRGVASAYPCFRDQAKTFHVKHRSAV